MLFPNAKEFLTLVIVLITITTQKLTNGQNSNWSAEKDKECLDRCRCEYHVPLKPVCGVDGNTYGNKCSFTCAQCYLGEGWLSLVREEPCGGVNQKDNGDFRWWPQGKDLYNEYDYETEETTLSTSSTPRGPSTRGPRDSADK